MITTQVVLALLVGVIMGAILMRLSVRFLKSTGKLVVNETDEGLTYTLQLEEEPADLIKRHYILFRVSKRSH